MMVISKILVDTVKQIIDTTNLKSVCLTASHKDSVGCVLQTDNKFGFTCEEDLFRVVVREAVDELNKNGYNVDQSGIDEHEYDLKPYDGYDLIISNHFDWDKGKKAVYFSDSYRGSAINDVKNYYTSGYGIGHSVAEYSDFRMCLDVTDGKGVLIEWFSAADNYDVNILLSQTDGSGPTPEHVTPPLEEGTQVNYTEYAETGKWISLEQFPVIAFSSIQDAIDFNDNTVINEIFGYGEIIAEYDTVFQDSDFNYIHWVSDNGEHRYAPTSKIGGANKIGWFE